MEASNYYKDKAKREFLNSTPNKEKIKDKNSLEETPKEETSSEKVNRTIKDLGKDLAIGVLAGGLGASIFGRYSFFAGVAISGYGHYTKNTALTTFGLGMMSSSSMTAAQGIKQNQNATAVENMQERVKAFGEELKRKLFLDKLMTDDKKDKGVQKIDLQGAGQKKETNKVPNAGETKTDTKTQNDGSQVETSTQQTKEASSSTSNTSLVTSKERPFFVFSEKHKKALSSDSAKEPPLDKSIEEHLY